MRQTIEESSSACDRIADSGNVSLVDVTRCALAGPERDVLFERDERGAWIALTNLALLARVEAVALGLRARGVNAGDRVALMSANRVDWIVANLGILFAAAVSVPIYPTQALDHVRYILADSRARTLFVDTPEAVVRLRAAGITLAPTLFDAAPGDAESFTDLVADGLARRATAADNDALHIDPTALAILIYTSGTTGTPKGVMLSHRNIATNALDAFGMVADVIRPGDPVLSILPFAHIYENTNMFGYLARGATVYVNRRLDALLEDLRSVRPVAMFAVPRVFERTCAGIVATSVAAGGVRARLVPWALRVGLAYRRALADGRPALPLRARFALAHALVLRKIRAQLGCDRLRFFVSGSASLHPDITLTFAAADLLIMEGYGLTECAPIVTVNRPDRYKLGTVGPPIPNVEIRLDDDGELLVRGPNVMLGYYGRSDETAAAIRDGWLATGDIATIDADGFVRIVDRKDEIFKTSGGKYISPTRVESALARSPFVAQAVVFGSGKAHPMALISPNWGALRAQLGLPADAPADDLATHERVRTFFANEAQRATADLAPYEQIRWTGVLPRELTIEAGEVTPTLKVRRRVVEERHGNLVRESRRGAMEEAGT